MTKFYMIKNQKILDAVAIYKKNYKERNKFIADFYSSHGIDGHQYYLAGNGPINKPFTDTWEKHIALHIENTTNNLSKFATELKRSRQFNDLYEFKKTSKTLKEFQKECIIKKLSSILNQYIGVTILRIYAITHILILLFHMMAFYIWELPAIHLNNLSRNVMAL